MKKIIIYTFYPLDLKSGGNIVLHKLAQDLVNLGFCAMLYCPTPYINDFCNSFATLDDIDEDTIVVYPEIVEGNPLNAAHVVRWMLCDLGVHVSLDVHKTWNPGDLLFHFSTFNNKYSPQDIKILYTQWIDPKIKNRKEERSGACYLFKKASFFHQTVSFIHPKDAILIDSCSMDEILDIFNRTTHFYCYDPYSFFDVIAALCGCVPVVYPIMNVSKREWLQTRAAFEMLLHVQDNISGIAYGTEDIPYAETSLSNVHKEQDLCSELGMKSVIEFLNVCEDYFFKSKDTHQFNTVANISKKLQWDASASTLEGKLQSATSALKYSEKQGKIMEARLLQHQQCLQDLTHELKKKNDLITQYEHEIKFMRDSKFWKLRQLLKGT